MENEVEKLPKSLMQKHFEELSGMNVGAKVEVSPNEMDNLYYYVNNDNTVLFKYQPNEHKRMRHFKNFATALVEIKSVSKLKGKVSPIEIKSVLKRMGATELVKRIDEHGVDWREVE